MSEQKSGKDTSPEPMTERQAYNVVTDTLGGPNLRLKDNLFQGVGLFGSAIFLMIYRAIKHARGQHD